MGATWNVLHRPVEASAGHEHPGQMSLRHRARTQPRAAHRHCNALAQSQMVQVLLVAENLWRPALLSGALTRDAPTRFRLRHHRWLSLELQQNGRALDGRSEHVHVRGNRRCRAVRTAGKRSLKARRCRSSLLGAHRCTLAHAHSAVMCSIATAAGRERILRILPHRHRRREQRQAEDDQQQRGNAATKHHKMISTQNAGSTLSFRRRFVAYRLLPCLG